jgi:hypothetical protein
MLEIIDEIRPRKEERATLRQRALIWFGIVCALALLLLALPGCASSERFMTKEQDDEMRANCAEHGCTVIPNPVWEQIEQVLKRLGMSGA